MLSPFSDGYIFWREIKGSKNDNKATLGWKILLTVWSCPQGYIPWCTVSISDQKTFLPKKKTDKLEFYWDEKRSNKERKSQRSSHYWVFRKSFQAIKANIWNSFYFKLKRDFFLHDIINIGGLELKRFKSQQVYYVFRCRQ